MGALEWMTTKLTDATNWARKFSLFQYPFVTACCGMEYMSVTSARYDIARFGAEVPRFSPRQADMLMVVLLAKPSFEPLLELLQPVKAIAAPITSNAMSTSARVFFMGILVVALAYVWRKRAVGWE